MYWISRNLPLKRGIKTRQFRAGLSSRVVAEMLRSAESGKDVARMISIRRPNEQLSWSIVSAGSVILCICSTHLLGLSLKPPFFD